MRDIWDDMTRWLEGGHDFAVARVVNTWGSSPRPVGAAKEAYAQRRNGVVELAGEAVFVQVLARRDKLTHDPKIDDEALGVLLGAGSAVRYIGALGSRKTHARRAERLQGEGFSEEAIEKIKGPVGLDIGAKSPAEIALSIMAEVVAVRRDR